MFSDGEYIGGGEQRLYTPANATITVGGSTSYLTVSVSGGTRVDVARGVLAGERVSGCERVTRAQR